MSKYAPHRRSANQPRATSSTVCQKCLGSGHFIFECKASRPYVSRPSRTQQLENPRLLAKLKAEGKPSIEVPEEFKNKAGTANRILESKEKERMKEIKDKEEGLSRKRPRRSSSSESGSSSDSGSGSDSETDSDSNSESSGSDSGSSRSRSRKRRLPARRNRNRSKTSSSEGSNVSRGRRS